MDIFNYNVHPNLYSDYNVNVPAKLLKCTVDS